MTPDYANYSVDLALSNLMKLQVEMAENFLQSQRSLYESYCRSLAQCDLKKVREQ